MGSAMPSVRGGCGLGYGDSGAGAVVTVAISYGVAFLAVILVGVLLFAMGSGGKR